MYKFCALGDLHLDKLDGLFANANELLFNEWSKSADYALEQEIKELIILGDVADRSRLSEEARVTLQDFLYKYDSKLNIRIILGNHDVEHEGMHSLEAIANMVKNGAFKSVKVYTKPKQLVLGGVPVNFLPFPHSSPIPYKGMQTLNIVHLERPGALRDNGTSIDADHGVKDESDHIFVSGHLHTPHEVGNTHFVGTLYQTNFGERLPKSFTVGKVVAEGKQLRCKLIRVPNDPAFKLTMLKVESVNDLKKITNNPLHLFKVVVKRGVELPYDVGAKHPNVVNSIATYKTEKEATAILQDSEVQIKFDLLDRLTQELKERGLSKEQAKRGKQIVEEIQSNL